MRCSARRVSARAAHSCSVAAPGSARRCFSTTPCSRRAASRCCTTRRSNPRPSSRLRAYMRCSGRCSFVSPRFRRRRRAPSAPRSRSSRSRRRTGSPSTRARSASSAWRPRAPRCSSSSTTHTGSTARLPRRSPSPRGGSPPSRSHSCLPSAKARAPTSASRFPRSSWSRSRLRRPWSFFTSGSARRSPRMSPATSPRRRAGTRSPCSRWLRYSARQNASGASPFRIICQLPRASSAPCGARFAPSLRRRVSHSSSQQHPIRRRKATSKPWNRRKMPASSASTQARSRSGTRSYARPSTTPLRLTSDERLTARSPTRSPAKRMSTDARGSSQRPPKGRTSQ